MNSKTMIAVAVGAIAAFLLGWLVWGILLMDYFNSNTFEYEGLMLAEPRLWAIFISNLVNAFLYAWLFQRMTIKGFSDGLIVGAVVSGVFAISVNMMFYAMMNWYTNSTVIIVDILINTAYGAVVAGIIAMLMSRGEAKN